MWILQVIFVWNPLMHFYERPFKGQIISYDFVIKKGTELLKASQTNW